MVIIRIARGTGGGGGSNFTDYIPMVMELPQGVVANPDVLAVTTLEAFKVTGFSFPDGAAASIVNLKCQVPSELAAIVNQRILFKFVTVSAEAAANTRMLVQSLFRSDAESIDVNFTDETEATVPMPAAIETFEYYSQTLTDTPVAEDQLFLKITRDPTDGSDTYAGNPFLIGAWLVVDRTTT